MKTREMQLDAMEKASRAFYAAAVQTGVHGFIEFTGLMNEYIAMLRATPGELWEVNKHTGTGPKMYGHHAEYLGEKFGCIYGPALKDPNLLRVFLRAAELTP